MYACVLCLSDTVDEDDDLYDFVEDEENKGDEIYEDLMRTDELPEVVGVGARSVQRVVQAQLPTGPHWALTASSGVSLHSSRRLAWTSESAACRRSDRRRRNTRIRSSPFYRYVFERFCRRRATSLTILSISR